MNWWGKRPDWTPLSAYKDFIETPLPSPDTPAVQSAKHASELRDEKNQDSLEDPALTAISLEDVYRLLRNASRNRGSGLRTR
jgi:hypothetical protein